MRKIEIEAGGSGKIGERGFISSLGDVCPTFV
jgi:hypothetical protein